MRMLLTSHPDLLGMSAPDFSLRGTDDRVHSLHDYDDATLLVVIFLCNHCPYVKAIIPRLNALAREFAKKNVRFVGINANDAAQYPDDSFENMKHTPLVFDYLYDETQEVAKAYKAVCTPDVFVFDADRVLRYHGRVDDNWQDENAVTKHELRDALNALLRGEEVTKQHPSMGCSIKWKVKN